MAIVARQEGPGRLMNSEDLIPPSNSVGWREKVAFARWAMTKLQETEHWRLSYAEVQDAAIAEAYERLVEESEEAILEVIDQAFSDLVASYEGDAELDGAMDALALEPSLLKMSPELTERLRQSMLDQALLLMMLSAAGQAAESRGILESARFQSSESTSD